MRNAPLNKSYLGGEVEHHHNQGHSIVKQATLKEIEAELVLREKEALAEQHRAKESGRDFEADGWRSYATGLTLAISVVRQRIYAQPIPARSRLA